MKNLLLIILLFMSCAASTKIITSEDEKKYEMKISYDDKTGECLLNFENNTGQTINTTMLNTSFNKITFVDFKANGDDLSFYASKPGKTVQIQNGDKIEFEFSLIKAFLKKSAAKNKKSFKFYWSIIDRNQPLKDHPHATEHFKEFRSEMYEIPIK